MEVPIEKVLINIDHYGNTSAGTLPLCIWDNEAKLKKGDNILFTAFGAGFRLGCRICEMGLRRSRNVKLKKEVRLLKKTMRMIRIDK
jgi:hypothetical protein